MQKINSTTALNRLLEGNQTYRERDSVHYDNLQQARDNTKGGQTPFAVIVTCSDSRVPPEIIFNQTIGDLFVIRIAGNTISDDVWATLEFAVNALNIPFIMVMGHSNCGAVTSAMGENHLNGHLGGLLNKIRNNISHVCENTSSTVEDAVKENVRVTCNAITEHFTEAVNITVAGAYYSLDSGKVEVLDN